MSTMTTDEANAWVREWLLARARQMGPATKSAKGDVVALLGQMLENVSDGTVAEVELAALREYETLADSSFVTRLLQLILALALAADHEDVTAALELSTGDQIEAFIAQLFADSDFVGKLIKIALASLSETSLPEQ